ncbi:glycosyltransferase family 39 protein [candidate division KSB1 bacterium]|nr:glycosyltransferase family 39 protein [candidate division KSB1 bacterium]
MPPHAFSLLSVPRRLVLIIGLAAALRLFGLASESLWLDEGHTYFEITQSWSSAFHDKTQGPVFILLEKLFCGQFGASEWTLRFLPACFGIAAIPALFALARQLFDDRTALVAALLAAINPTWIHYSQDARPYSLLLLAVILSCWTMQLWLKRPGTRTLVLCLVSMLVAIYSHAFGALLLLASLLWCLAFLSRNGELHRARLGKQIALIGALIALLSLPAVLQYAGKLEGRMAGDALGGWIKRPSLFMLLAAIHHYFMYPVLSIAAGLLVLRAGIGQGRLVHWQWRPLLALSGLYVSFVVIPWLISVTFAPVLIPRYTLPASIAVLIILAWSIAAMPRPNRVIWVSVWVVISTIGLWSYYAGSDKDPWRETAARLRREMQAGDLIVLSPGYVAEPMSYYFEPTAGIELAVARRATPLDSLLSNRDRVWLITAYGSEQGDLLQRLREAAAQARRLVSHCTVEPYAPKDPWALWQAEISVSLYAAETP